jgi:hypothetical protein
MKTGPDAVGTTKNMTVRAKQENVADAVGTQAQQATQKGKPQIN